MSTRMFPALTCLIHLLPGFRQDSRSSLNPSTTPLNHPTLAVDGITRKEKGDLDRLHHMPSAQRNTSHKKYLANKPLTVAVKK